MTQDPEKTPKVEDLEPWFQAARDQSAVPSDALMSRILADARSEQIAQQAVPVRVAPRVSIWDHITQALGGWRGLSGLTACGVLGVFLGFSTPDTVVPYATNFGLGAETALILGEDPDTLFTDLGLLLSEEF